MLILDSAHASQQAGQPNSATATLAANGVGLLDGAGLPIPYASMVFPGPPGSAPRYYAAVAPRTAIELRVKGAAPGMPLLIAYGPIAAAPLTISPGNSLELAFPGLGVLVDGFSPGGNIFNASAVLGAGNTWSLVVGSGLPPGAPNINLQAAVVDPSCIGCYRLSGSVSIETRNTPDAVARNFVDGFSQSASNPLYLLSGMTSDFLWSGSTAGQFLGHAIAEQSSGAPAFFSEVSVGANAPGAAAPPAGAPLPGQSVSLALSITESEAQTCPSGSTQSFRWREHGIVFREQAGAWKIAGNSLPVEVSVRVRITRNPAAPVGFDTELMLQVEDESGGANGGIASVEVFGPQLANVNGSNQAQNATCGSLQLNTNGGGSNGSSWNRFVIVGDPVAGTSRRPWVENHQAAPDLYTFKITWNNQSIWGPAVFPPTCPQATSIYTIPLRCSLDLLNAPASVLAAIPGGIAPVTLIASTLCGPGNTIPCRTLSFDAGTLTPTALRNDIAILINQPISFGQSFEFEGLLLDAIGPLPQLVTICDGGLSVGPASVIVERMDVYENQFRRSLTMNL